jgi:hypothetical protein
MEKAYPDISCAHAAKMLSLKEGGSLLLFSFGIMDKVLCFMLLKRKKKLILYRYVFEHKGKS